MPTGTEVVFVILSSYPTFQPESFDTKDEADRRMQRIVEMDPNGFARGAYWITSYEQ